MREGTTGAILALLREKRRQAQELAAILGIDTSAVRRHLESLAAEGLVDAEETIDGPGRPKKKYGLTPEGRETFPRDYALLLGTLLPKVAEVAGRERLERAIALIAKDLALDVEGRTHEERIAAMLALYNKLGFEAEIERDRGRTAFTLIQRNCIFLKTARADPDLLCQCLDEGIMRAALTGANVELKASLAHGDAHCRHHIQLPKSRT